MNWKVIVLLLATIVAVTLADHHHKHADMHDDKTDQMDKHENHPNDPNDLNNQDDNKDHHKHHKGHQKHRKGKHGHRHHKCKNGKGKRCINYEADCVKSTNPKMKEFVAKDPEKFQKFKSCFVEMLTCLKGESDDADDKCKCMREMVTCSLSGAEENLIKEMQMKSKEKFEKKLQDIEEKLEDKIKQKIEGKGINLMEEIEKKIRKKIGKKQEKKMKKLQNNQEKKLKMGLAKKIKMAWMKKMPKALKMVFMKNMRCIKSAEKECNEETLACFEKNRKKTVMILNQICAHELAHCDGTKDECETNWRNCVQPDETKEAISYEPAMVCHDESTEDVEKCLLDMKHRSLPTLHCRKKICCKRAKLVEDETTTEASYEECMSVNAGMRASA